MRFTSFTGINDAVQWPSASEVHLEPLVLCVYWSAIQSSISNLVK